jgi:hypothetical protein
LTRATKSVFPSLNWQVERQFIVLAAQLSQTAALIVRELALELLRQAAWEGFEEGRAQSQIGNRFGESRNDERGLYPRRERRNGRGG